jgi:uncharacterized protein (DUF2252 family)
MGTGPAHKGRMRLPEVEPLPPMSVRERIARGLAARDRVPLDSHGRWAPEAGRMDPVSVLERQASARDSALVPLRHGRMAGSAFAFYRGGAAIMAADLATTRSSGLRAQLCGDAHLVNFGIFDTPERAHVFDINDFDETLEGPWEWDVKRLAASVEVAARDLGLRKPERNAAVRACVGGYRERMAELAEMSNLEVWHARLEVGDLLRAVEKKGDKNLSAALEHDVRKGMRRNHLTAFGKLIDTTGGEARFASHPPLLVPIDELLDDRARRRYVGVIREFLRQYRASLSTEHQHLLDGYRYVHLARKVVGVGSVGTRAMVVLMTGLNEADPLMLQLKEAKRSVLEPYCGPSPHRNRGQRVVDGQRLMQTASDPLLGWYRLRALDNKVHDFYVRQLWDGKASIDVTHLTPDALSSYARVCGVTLARAHARSGFRVSISAYLGDTDEFDLAVAEFASAYADTNEQDYAALLEAIESERIAADFEDVEPASQRHR